MKKYLLLLVSAILIVLYPVSETYAKSSYATTTYKTPVSVTYVWKQSFKEKISKKSVTTKNIYLTEYNKSTRIPVSISLLKGETIVQIKPKKALKAGRKYTLILQNIKSVKGKVLTKKPLKKIFTTKKPVTKPVVTKPVEVKPQPAITSTTIKTTSKTLTGVIGEQNGKVTIIYDFRSLNDQELIESSMLIASQNYTLTFTKVPQTVSLFIPENYTEKLIKGENNILLVEKIKEYQANIGLMRLLGNFSLEGTLTDEANHVKPITLTFSMK